MLAKHRVSTLKDIKWSKGDRKETLTFVFHPKPRASAQTIVLFPVPFGPITMFKLGPGVNEHDSYVTKLFIATFMMEPCWYLLSHR